MGKLDGKTAVITGESSGIGLATVRKSVAEGVHLYLPGRREAEQEKAEAELGRNVATVPGDVARTWASELRDRGIRVNCVSRNRTRRRRRPHPALIYPNIGRAGWNGHREDAWAR